MKKLISAIAIVSVSLTTVIYLTLATPKSKEMATVIKVKPTNKKMSGPEHLIQKVKNAYDQKSSNNSKSINNSADWTDIEFAQKVEDKIDAYNKMGFELERQSDYTNLSDADLQELYELGDIYAIRELADRAQLNNEFDIAYKLRKENIGLGSLASAHSQFMHMTNFLKLYEEDKMPIKYLIQAANLHGQPGLTKEHYIRHYKLRMFASTLSASYLGDKAKKDVNNAIYYYLNNSGKKHRDFFESQMASIVRFAKDEYNKFNNARQHRGIDLLATKPGYISSVSLKEYIQYNDHVTAQISQSESD